MGAKQQTHAKRARELAVKETRELKRAKKAARAAGDDPAADAGAAQAEAESEWIQ